MPGHHHHNHNHYSRRYTPIFGDSYGYYGYYRPWSLRESLIGLGILIAVVVPIMIIMGIIKLISIATAPVVAATALTSSLVGVASISTGGAAIAATFATLGFAGLVMYGIVGVVYLSSAAREAYNSKTSGVDLLKLSFIPQEGWSFVGVVKCAGAVLLSPFMLMGVLSGKAVKAAVQAYKGSSDVDITLTALEEGELDLEGSVQSKQKVSTTLDETICPGAGRRTTSPSFFPAVSSEELPLIILPSLFYQSQAVPYTM